jgi:hypothetical protein
MHARAVARAVLAQLSHSSHGSPALGPPEQASRSTRARTRRRPSPVPYRASRWRDASALATRSASAACAASSSAKSRPRPALSAAPCATARAFSAAARCRSASSLRAVQKPIRCRGQTQVVTNPSQTHPRPSSSTNPTHRRRYLPCFSASCCCRAALVASSRARPSLSASTRAARSSSSRARLRGMAAPQKRPETARNGQKRPETAPGGAGRADIRRDPPLLPRPGPRGWCVHGHTARSQPLRLLLRLRQLQPQLAHAVLELPHTRLRHARPPALLCQTSRGLRRRAQYHTRTATQ